MAEKTVSARVVVNADNASAVLKALGSDAQIAFDIMTKRSQEAGRSLDRAGDDVRGFAGSARNAFGQLGYQLQDFVVQVQGGTSVVTALTQQGSQLAGAFGPIPALIAGLTGAVVGVAGAFIGFNDEIKKTPDYVDGVLKSFDAIGKQADDTAERIRGLSESQRELVRQAAELEQKGLRKEADQSIESVGSELISRYRQNLDRESEGRLQALSGLGDVDPLSLFAGISIKNNRSATAEADKTEAELKQALDLGDFGRVTDIVASLGLGGDPAAMELIEKARRLFIAKMNEQAAGQPSLVAARTDPSPVSGTELDVIGRPTPVPVARDEKAADAQIEADDRKRQQAIAKEKADRERAAKANLDFELRQLDVYYQQQDQAEKEAQQGKKENLDFELRQLDQYFKEQDKAQDEANRLAEQKAKEMADILAEPWRQLAAEVAKITGDMFEQFLETGKVSIDSLATSLSQGVRGIVSQTLGTVVSMPLQQGVAGLSQSLNQSIASGQGIGAGIQQWAQANPGTAALGAGALGLTAGNTITAATGGNMVGSSIGGVLGGGAGFLIGNALLPGVGGIAGAGIGSLLGGTVGGLFGGGEQNLGNDRAALDYWTSVGTSWQDKSSSPENRQVVNSFASQVDSLVEAIGQLGGTVDNINLRFSAGNKTGLQLNGQTYGSQADLLNAVFKLVGGASEGLSDNQQLVFQNTKASSTAELASDLQFAETLDRVRQNLGPVATALADVDDQFTAMTQKANALGLTTDGLSDAYDRQRQTIIDNVERQIRDFTNNNQYLTAFDALTDKFKDLEQAANDLGRGTDDLEAAYQDQLDTLQKTADAQASATEDQYRSQVRSLTGLFDSLLAPINQALGPFGISSGIAAPTATVSGGLDQFRTLLGQAREGDVAALQQITGVGQSTIGAARQYGASGMEFQDVFKEVNAGLGELQNKLQDRQIEALKGIEDVGRETVDELVRLRTQGIESLAEQLEQLRLEVRQLADRRAAA